MTVARHEAAHAAAAIMLGRRVEHVERNPGLTRVGEELGHCLAPVGERIELSQVIMCLVGYASEDTPGWPPDFEHARTEDLEALGKVITLLGLDEEAYDATVALTRDMLADDDFKGLRGAIARALSAVPRLEREDIQALAAIHLPEQETAA